MTLPSQGFSPSPTRARLNVLQEMARIHIGAERRRFVEETRERLYEQLALYGVSREDMTDARLEALASGRWEFPQAAGSPVPEIPEPPEPAKDEEE